MGFSNFWRGEHRGEREDRDRYAMRGRTGEHRGYGGREGERYGGQSYEERDEESQRRGSWREETLGRPERYSTGGYGGQGEGSYRERDRDEDEYLRHAGSREDWRERGGQTQGYGSRGRENYAGESFNDRWENAYGVGASGGMRGSYGPYAERSYTGSGGEGYREFYGSTGRDYRSSGYGGQERYGSQGYGGGRSAYGSQGGPYRGRGPRGYRRSDDRIREDVCECLTEDDCIDASNMDVAVRECEVTLSGTVNSREEKRRAEDLIEDLPGVKEVTNNLRVVSESGQSESTGRQGEVGTQGRQQGQATQSSKH
jgi:osmotically-inducible protein OsmY